LRLILPLLVSFFFFRRPRPPTPTLFPYTTLFRSRDPHPPFTADVHAATLHGHGCDLFQRNVRSSWRVYQDIFDRGDEKYPGRHRSEEHTSELQSRGHLVCRLLLEKKKKIKKHYT